MDGARIYGSAIHVPSAGGAVFTNPQLTGRNGHQAATLVNRAGGSSSVRDCNIATAEFVDAATGDIQNADAALTTDRDPVGHIQNRCAAYVVGSRPEPRI